MEPPGHVDGAWDAEVEGAPSFVEGPNRIQEERVQDVVAGAGDRLKELPVKALETDGIDFVLFRRQDQVQCGEVVLGAALGGQPRHFPLDEDAELLDVSEGVEALAFFGEEVGLENGDVAFGEEVADVDAVAVADAEKALGLKSFQRLSDGGTVDAELLGEVPFGG
jgi:hypothetical protein